MKKISLNFTELNTDADRLRWLEQFELHPNHLQKNLLNWGEQNVRDIQDKVVETVRAEVLNQQAIVIVVHFQPNQELPVPEDAELAVVEVSDQNLDHQVDMEIVVDPVVDQKDFPKL